MDLGDSLTGQAMLSILGLLWRLRKFDTTDLSATTPETAIFRAIYKYTCFQALYETFKFVDSTNLNVSYKPVCALLKVDIPLRLRKPRSSGNACVFCQLTQAFAP